jgi:hypothetical protein
MAKKPKKEAPDLTEDILRAATALPPTLSKERSFPLLTQGRDNIADLTAIFVQCFEEMSAEERIHAVEYLNARFGY